MSEAAEVVRLVQWLAGKEGRDDDVGALARHVRDRPQSGRDVPWPTFDALKTNCRHYGPPCPASAVDTAIAEFRVG